MLAKVTNYFRLMMKLLYLHKERVMEEVQRWSVLANRFF